MVLADTSVWIPFLAGRETPHTRALDSELAAETVLCHPYVVAELALGSLGRRRESIMQALQQLPSMFVAAPSEVIALVEARSLHSRGIGYVDASLAAATLLRPGTRLLTQDRRLSVVTRELGIAAPTADEPTP